jgi:hypothetical protein
LEVQHVRVLKILRLAPSPKKNHHTGPRADESSGCTVGLAAVPYAPVVGRSSRSPSAAKLRAGIAACAHDYAPGVPITGSDIICIYFNGLYQESELLRI